MTLNATAYGETIRRLAAWFAGSTRIADLKQATKALEALAKHQGRPRKDRLAEALRHSYVGVDVSNLREALLAHLVGPGCPVDLLLGFFWKFGTDCDRLPDDELLDAIRTFVEDLSGEDFDPETDEVCHPEEVVVQSGRMVLLGCSHPPGSAPRVFTAQLHSADGQAFRAGELMCAVVRAAADELRDSGHRFFQGLKLVGQVGNPVAWIPLYEMYFSSDWVPPGVDPAVGWERLQDLERWRADRRGDDPGASTDPKRRKRGGQSPDAVPFW
jgi:hypothetical protein